MLRTAIFDLGAAPYDLLTRQPTWRAHCRRLLDPLGPGGGRYIVDLGCGPAMSTIELARAYPNDRVTGLDLSSQMLRRAVRNARADDVEPSWVRGDALSLPFRRGCIQVLTGHSFLYLVPDRPLALREAMRVLAPGGHLVLLEPAERVRLSSVFDEGLALRFIASMVLWRVASKQAGRFTPQALGAALEAAGFESVEVTPAIHGMGLRAQGRRPG